MIESLITTLAQELNLTAVEIADICWLTLIRRQFASKIPSSSQVYHSPERQDAYNHHIDSKDISIATQQPHPVNIQQPHPVNIQQPHPVNIQQPDSNSTFLQQTSSNIAQVGLFTKESQSNAQPKTELKIFPFKVPNPSSIRNPLDLARSLRPLIQRIPSKYDTTLDENKTVQKIADERVWQAIIQPVLESWLDLALVVDESTSMLMWQPTILELQKLLQNYGAFRDVRTWGLSTNEDGKIGIRPGFGTLMTNKLRSPQELVDPSGRRLILLITDCVASIWQSGKVLPILKLWSDENPTAILQMLPEWLWVRTALKKATMAHFYATLPGVSNQQLSVIRNLAIEDATANTQKTEVKVPVFSLEPEMIFRWSQMLAGRSNVIVPGYIFQLDNQSSNIPATPSKLIEPANKYTPEQQLQRFRVASSPMARQLAILLAASPSISLPVIRLIQETLLPKSRQVNVAEVLLGGILKPKETPQIGKRPDEVEYNFVDGKIRSLLLESAPVPDTIRVLSDYIENKFQKSLEEFIALLRIYLQSEDEATVESSRPFATVTAEVLKRKGQRYSEFVQEVERKFGSVGLSTSLEVINFPKFQTFQFEIATISIEDELTSNLQPFEFEVAAIELKQSDLPKQKTELIIKRRRLQSYYFTEDLGHGVQLEMVQIPDGKFMMGASRNEKDSYEAERPQHQISIRSFYMSKYLVTQAQWQEVAALPQVNRELYPDPSTFKDPNRPVERVSWYDAVEFCSRLSQRTYRNYRLPSEAEWEYACRAGTSSSFHFGETITSELANYNANDSYGEGVKGTYRKQTTPVGSFKVANAFGLYDMHGNVWEWCLDDWHVNYEGAPTDERAWFDDNTNLSQKQGRAVRRGGSWLFFPKICRSAYRDDCSWAGRNFISNDVGFRVVCTA